MGFLGVTEPILELELERRLVEKIKQFLLELGQGFTYIGNQHVLSFSGKDYKVDMLFFHRGLRALGISTKLAMPDDHCVSFASTLSCRPRALDGGTRRYSCRGWR